MMRTTTKFHTFIGVISVAIIAISIIYVSQGERVIVEPSYPIDKVVRYSFNIRNKSNKFIKETTIEAFAPVLQTSSQKVVDLRASHAFTLEVDQFDNQLMSFLIKDIPPYGAKIITITASMSFSELPNALSIDATPYLKDSASLDITHQEMIITGNKLAANSNLMLAENIYNWVGKHIKYAGYVPEDKGALYALQNGSGDCTEYSQLVTALLRQQGTPARVVGGFVSDKSRKVLRASDYHNWAEYLDGRKWLLSDAQKQVHNKDYENYIAFRIIESEEGNPMGNSHRFIAFDHRLSVSMN